MKQFFIKTIIKTDLTFGVFFSLLLFVNISCKNSSTISETSSLSPAAPSNIAALSTASTSVTIGWTDNSNNESGFVIQRCAGASCTDFSTISASPISENLTSFSDSGLTASTIYRYRVAATSSFGTSSYITSSDITTSVSTASGSTNACTSPVTRVVDYGQRATAGATIAVRGAYTSIAMRPGTSYPGIAYSETHSAGASNLKFSYWTGSEWKYETVVSGVTTSYVKLVYITSSDSSANATPVIFWGNGATALYGATRSSNSLTAEGQWTVVAIDTSSTAIRGVDASVSPDGKVVVQFMTNTNVASGAKAIICSSNCHVMSTTNYPTSTVMDTVNTSTNSYSVGTSWCYSGSGTTYYPVLFYGSTGNFRMATCRESNLSNCSGNWTSGTVGVANANRLSVDSYIDPTTSNATAYLVALTGTGIQPYTLASCATATTSAGAWTVTTGTIFGAGTTGNAWMSLDKDSSGNFHVAANDAATIVRYFNVSTANFAAGTWSAAPSTNYTETTGTGGLQAGGSGRGGMIVDDTNDQILITYGRTASTTPLSTWGNVVIAYNDCPSGIGSPACSSTTLGSAAASTGMWWGNMAADITGQIQKTSLAWPNVSVATTSTGNPAVAYVDYSVSGTTDPIIGARLKYAYRDGSTASSSPYKISVIGGQGSPQSPSLAFDENNLPWIAWNETPSASVSQKFFLATNTRTDGQGTWTIYNFPVYYLVGTVTAQPVMPQAVVVMYEVSGVKHPMVVTMSSVATVAGRVVRAGLFNKSTRSWNNIKQVAIFAGTTTIGGAWLSADSDSSGNIVIAFNDMSAGTGQVYCSSTARCIRFGYTSDGGATWSTTSTSGVINGAYESARVKINPTNSRPAIAYFDRANNMIRYSNCTTSLSSCTSSANWSPLGPGVIDSALGISGLAEATNIGVVSAGFTFTSEGYPWVVYPRGAASASGNLMMSYVSTSGGIFSNSTALYTPPGSGIISSPVAATANNKALSWNPSSVRSIYTGSLHTAFIGHGNFLYMTSCGD